MLADFGRLMKSGSKPGPGHPITRDFLGGCFGIESKELDLDLHVPVGWEKRLDLQSGKVYIERCKSPSPPTIRGTDQTTPSSSNTNLDLNLMTILPSNATYQSVCTLDKVKSALQRASYKVSPSPTTSSSKKRPSSPSNSDSSIISITKNNDDDHEKSENGESGMLVAGACPRCLMYVLISKSNPKCLKCNSLVSFHTSSKKAKIDLNM